MTGADILFVPRTRFGFDLTLSLRLLYFFSKYFSIFMFGLVFVRINISIWEFTLLIISLPRR